MLLTCLSMKEKLEKAFLGICLDILLFSKGLKEQGHVTPCEEGSCAISVLLNKKAQLLRNSVYLVGQR